MIECGFYNMDCMEGLKEMPDKSVDLAIVDPPYGDALQNEGGGTITDSARGSTVTRGGWHGKQKYHLGAPSAEELPQARRDMGLRELAGHGRRNTQKNYYVGRSAETGIF